MKPVGTRKPYGGASRSLVLALDVGTTFSGVSYAILEPGEVPKIHGVTRFPGQEHVAGNSKIPTIMYYDSEGKMRAAGAEADGASIEAQAEDEGWIKVELFKLRLRPKSMALKMNGMRLGPLPHQKTAVDVFGDFLGYLFRCTKSFIIDTHANGAALYRAVEHDVQLVVSHPNGWEGAQQTKMRRAAVYGGLVPDTDEGKARIRFVTEGEASLHACVLNGLAADVLSDPSGHGFIVADAGGGTLDISSYAIRGTSPLVIEEIAPPDCVFAGSVFVSRRARAFFEQKLKNSKYGTPDSLDHITKRFDETTKRLFRDDQEAQFVHFGSPLDKDIEVGIRTGNLKLTGAEVADLFEPSIQAAVASIKNQINASSAPVKSVWLVGGFAASPWLFAQLQEHLAPFNITVSRPDSQTSKAVADGAIGFYCDHHVSARMSKFMYGVEYLREFDPSDGEHVSRKHRLFELPSGPKLLPDAFDCILSRGIRVKESTVFSRKYCTEVTNLSTLSVFEVEIWCFRGGDVIPKWILRDAENFSTLCYVRADLSPLAGSATSKVGRNGKSYWTIVFSIEIHFGLTEFKARIKWVDNGKTKYGPASIVYNESGHRAEEDEPDSSPEDSVTVASNTPSAKPSRAHSRDTRPSSRGVSTPHIDVSRSSTHARAPSIDVAPRGFERERTISRSSTTGHSVRSPVVDKGKERERYADSHTPRPEAMRDRDRSINQSGVSVDSTRSGSTRLGEALSSVWGSAKSPTSPLGDGLRSPTTPYDDTRVPTPREMSKLATPRELSKVPTPREFSKAPTPRELSKAPSPIISKAPSPKELSKAPTPQSLSKAPTPKSVSIAPTPHIISNNPTPRELSRAASPVPARKELSRAPSPKPPTRVPSPIPAEPVRPPTPQPEVIRVPTPQPDPLRAPTPQPESFRASTPPQEPPRVPTPQPEPEPEPPAPAEVVETPPEPEVVEEFTTKGKKGKKGSKATSKAASKAASKATSKVASKVPSPKVEPESLPEVVAPPEEPPALEEPSIPEVAAATEVPATTEPEASWGAEDPVPVVQQAELSVPPSAEEHKPKTPPPETSTFDSFFDTSAPSRRQSSHPFVHDDAVLPEAPEELTANHGLSELMSPSGGEAGFGDFLSSNGWGAAGSKRSSRSAQSGSGGGFLDSFGGGPSWGAKKPGFGGFGSTLGGAPSLGGIGHSLGSALGSTFNTGFGFGLGASNPAEQNTEAEEAASKKAAEEAEMKRLEEETAAQKAEEERLQQEKEAEDRRVREEADAAAAAEEEARNAADAGQWEGELQTGGEEEAWNATEAQAQEQAEQAAAKKKEEEEAEAKRKAEEDVSDPKDEEKDEEDKEEEDKDEPEAISRTGSGKNGKNKKGGGKKSNAKKKGNKG